MKPFSNFIDDFKKRNLEYTLRKEFFRIIILAKKRKGSILTASDSPFWTTNYTFGKTIYLTDEFWIQPIAFKTLNTNFREVISTILKTNIEFELRDAFILSNKQYVITHQIMFNKKGEKVGGLAIAPTKEPQINSNLSFLVTFLAKLLEEKELKFDIF